MLSMIRGRLALLMGLALALGAIGGVVQAGTAYAVQSPPRKSTSYYVGTTDTTTAYNQGCSQGQQDSIAPTQNSEVVLDFGGQNYSNTGSILIGGPEVTFGQIQSYAEQFARGYYVCTGSNTASQLLLAIGTNNSAYQVSYSGGATWANQVVGPVQAWVAGNGVGNQVMPVGGNDMEPGFHGVVDTRAWLQGYSDTGKGRVTNYGSADGCPQYTSNNGLCNNGWSQADVWWLSWGNPSGFAMPEIYYYANSGQWTMISQYGFTYQGQSKIYFDGPLTQYGYNGSYTSDQAWNVFWSDLNARPDTAQYLTYRSDI